MKRALLSVWNKDGIQQLANALHNAGIEILSSGGTGTTLNEAGIPFIEVSQYTGFPEMMDGRVKTLHPLIHGGLLGRRGKDDAIMAEHNIRPIDLLVVNLYPFEEMAEQGLLLEELIEFIDIGGPAMIRGAAKNYRDVAVIIDPADYPLALHAIKNGGFTEKDRLYFARKVFARMAAYDGAISNYLYSLDKEFPSVYSTQFKSGRMLRYGENPHQTAAVYGTEGIAAAVPLQGKEMSYNNYLDLHAAVLLLREFSGCTAVIVKHNNPCGVASADTSLQAYITARDCDPVSAYGSIVAVNEEVDLFLAEEIASTFVEVLAAPSFSPDARSILAKKENLRIVSLPRPAEKPQIRSIDGGILIQKTKNIPESWTVVTDRDPSAKEEESMRFAMKVCKHTKSNAIVFARSDRALGIGAGQMNRVESARIAIMKSNEPLDGSAVASDAFLPFPDTLCVAADAGATALIQPGGSIRDNEVIEEANRRGMAMIFTGIRHFRH
ncbi:MAG: bifunctional phosphoribosylaminoimidazolecarboxamide formyltransferase/IMP cyclohydrolase [Methanospirillaceae archaeon]|nr:bifunctional phosphoribosylaminoimidazolecarboxamide formyltransferase/IMP cyclohydrolase [Methanospirillaceae archaeon]